MSWIKDIFGFGSGVGSAKDLPGTTLFTPPIYLSPREAMTLSTVFACVDVISSGVAKLPLVPYRVTDDGLKARAPKDDLYYMLNFTPNDNQTRFDFLKALLVSVLLDGNGYARIRRNDATGYGAKLELWQSKDVSIILDKKDTTIKGYYNARLDEEAKSEDVIHIRNFSDDGIRGVSVLTYARKALSLNARAD